MNAALALRELDVALAKLRIEPSTMMADLTLLGLSLDAQAQGKAALALAAAGHPDCAGANARVAFEAGQQAVVLAANPEYGVVGTRAWVFFARKDRDLRARASTQEKARAKYAAERQRFRAIASKIAPETEEWFDRAEASLEQQVRAKPRPPDNWLGKDMAHAYQGGLQIILNALGKEAPRDSARIAGSAFKALCRMAHTRPRLSLRGIAKRADGSLFADVRESDPMMLEAAIDAAVAGAALDAMMALCYRISRSA